MELGNSEHSGWEETPPAGVSFLTGDNTIQFIIQTEKLLSKTWRAAEARARAREKQSCLNSHVSSLVLAMTTSTLLCFLISSDVLPSRPWSCRGHFPLLIKPALRKPSASDSSAEAQTSPVHLACWMRLPRKQQRQQNRHSSFPSVLSQILDFLLRMRLHKSVRFNPVRAEAHTDSA